MLQNRDIPPPPSTFSKLNLTCGLGKRKGFLRRFMLSILEFGCRTNTRGQTNIAAEIDIARSMHAEYKDSGKQTESDCLGEKNVPVLGKHQKFWEIYTTVQNVFSVTHDARSVVHAHKFPS